MFIVTYDTHNPGKAFVCDGQRPAVLTKGMVVTFNDLPREELDEHAAPADLEFLRRCAFLVLDTPENRSRIEKEIAAEKAAWEKMTDPHPSGISALKGFRTHDK